MAATIYSSLRVLPQQICEIVVVIYIISLRRRFLEVPDGYPIIKTQARHIFVFGVTSIYGAVCHIDIQGAIVKVRDLSLMIAGLIREPFVGPDAVLNWAAYRGSPIRIPLIPCTIATILAWFFGGLPSIGCKRNFSGGFPQSDDSARMVNLVI